MSFIPTPQAEAVDSVLTSAIRRTVDNPESCPFCASGNIETMRSLIRPGSSYVECQNCHATGPVGDGENEAERLWDKRARQ